MSRFLLFVLGFLLLCFFWRRPDGDRRKIRRDLAGRVTEDMVCCAHCGLYFPRSEGKSTPWGIFCCEEHRRAGEAQS